MLSFNDTLESPTEHVGYVVIARAGLTPNSFVVIVH